MTSGRFAIATHALALLARTAEGYASDYVASSINTHPAFLRRVMASLTRAGLVEARMGRGGGYRLAHPASAITLAQVYEVVEPEGPVAPSPSEPDPICQIGAGIAEAFDEAARDANEGLLHGLSQKSIADIARRAEELGRTRVWPLPREAALRHHDASPDSEPSSDAPESEAEREGDPEILSTPSVARRLNPMASKSVIVLNEMNFDTEVLKSETPVLVDFTATWCGPCKVLAPIVDELADEAKGAYKVAKLDIDESPTIAQRYSIRGVPTVLVFKDGKLKSQHVGLTKKQNLLKMITELSGFPMARLFDPLGLRGVTLRNRIGVSPMCQYSCDDGFATDWHLVHLGSRAVGGAGLIMVEATAVEAIGRISPDDMGLWKDAHKEPLARAARFIEQQGAVPGLQLAHAGRKGSTSSPWKGDRQLAPEEGGWTTVAPSPVPFREGTRPPEALTVEGVHAVTRAFVEAARRALDAGFRLLEIHAAHGYLLHEFLSPLSNVRTDEYGGSFDNRCRFLLETVRAVRAAMPDSAPLSVRLSCTDWKEGGWTPEDSVALSRRLKAEGVDIIDCSSGGAVPHVKIPAGPGYQLPFAEAIRSKAGIATAAVGFITEPAQADEIIASGKADVVLLARGMLRDPYWPLHAAEVLGEKERRKPPPQYERAY